MGNKNRIAAVLAIMAMVGFLLMFGAVCFIQVPPANKDFFNMGFIALIGFVGTAFGYYLGSSLSSAHKNELIAQGGQLLIPGDPVLTTKEAGFARLQVMALLLLVGILFLFTACATVKSDSPQITAGKSLLATKQVIVTAATTVDALCAAGTLRPASCSQAKAAYELSKPAYDSAVDAYLVMSTGGDPAQFATSLARLQEITNNLVMLGGGAK